mmetsp:Transcript_12817/g.32396  ORF Transcript_12817/g.32396 Transcript_12817/m.32396 type:complete len:274 (-) Transcript_12817:202-1023(-)
MEFMMARACGDMLACFLRRSASRSACPEVRACTTSRSGVIGDWVFMAGARRCGVVGAAASGSPALFAPLASFAATALPAGRFMDPFTQGWASICRAVSRRCGSACSSCRMRFFAVEDTFAQFFPRQRQCPTSTFSRIFCTLRSSKGVRPESRKYSRMPTAHMSTSPPTPFSETPCGSRTISGATNSGVPPGSVGTWKNVARLKSISLMGDSACFVLNTMFSGLRSMCATPWSCRWTSASHSWRTMRDAVPSLMGFRCDTRSTSSPPSQNSVTM